MVLNCADVGHLAAPPRTHRRWAFQLEEDFFRQVLPTCKDHAWCALLQFISEFGVLSYLFLAGLLSSVAW